MSTIFISIISMAGLGLFFASVLAFMNKKLSVKEDPTLEKLVEALPGVNCGACGFTSCHQYAEALNSGKVTPDLCKAGGEQIMCFLSEILGVKPEKKTKQLAIVHCWADESKRKKKANYTGIKTCLAANNMFGGKTFCDYGCLGFGDCNVSCPFGAITMINGLPKINKDKCTACGKCVEACPRSIIDIQDIDAPDFIYVACSNTDKGPATRKTCLVGCISCGFCERLTEGIFHVENNLARVKYDKMKAIKNSDEVVSKCPTKCILKI